MLSQRLVKSALALERSRTADEVARWRASVIAVLSEWRTAHRGLRQGDASLRLPPTTHPQLVAAFDALEPHFESMSAAAEDLISLARLPDADMRNPGLLDAVERLLSHEAEFLTRMHAIVGLYEAEARDHVADLQLTGWLLAISVILVALASQLAVLQPAISLLGRRMEQSERQYRLLVESMSDGLVLLDAMGRIRFANPRFCEMTGLVSQPLDGSRSSPAASTKPTDLLFTHCVDTTDIPVWLEILREAEPKVKQAELLLKVKNGCSLPVLVSARRFPRETGYHAALLLVISDISARKASEIRMRGLHEQLSHATRLKSMGEMATALAHEINQPLAGISMSIDNILNKLIKKTLKDDYLQNKCDNMMKYIERIKSIIEHIRIFSREQRDHQSVKFNILSSVKNAISMLKTQYSNHNINLKIEFDESVEYIILGNEYKMEQIILNLLSNAKDAVDDKFERLKKTGALEQITQGAYKKEIRLSLVKNMDNIEVVIEDNGCGIQKDNFSLIFDPFFTTKIADKGTGLGLSITHSLVEEMHGEIAVESVIDEFTRFTLKFPKM